MTPGLVYILLNDAMPGLIKIGWTERQAVDRLDELSAATGVPRPFRVVYEHHSADAPKLERAMHSVFEGQGRRFSPRREFFQASVSEAIKLAIDLSAAMSNTVDEARDDDPERPFGDVVLSGSGAALEELGSLYSRAGQDRSSRAISQHILDEGLRRGNQFCLVPLASRAAQDGRLAEFQQIWNRFFRAQSRPQPGIADHGRYMSALQHYLVGCLTLGVEPWQAALLEACAAPLLSVVDESLAGVDPVSGAYHWLKAARRWLARSMATTDHAAVCPSLNYGQRGNRPVAPPHTVAQRNAFTRSFLPRPPRHPVAPPAILRRSRVFAE